MTLENLAQNVGYVQESLKAKPITRLDWALAYAKLGYKIIPLKDDCPPEHWEHCKATKCREPKRPRPEVGLEWQNQVSSDPNQITAWWQQWPNANLGVHCRKSGLVVPDLDVHDSNKNGIVNFVKLQQANTFPNTPVQNTGTGGKHIFYKDIPGVEFIGKIQLAELVTDVATGVISEKVIEQGMDIKSNGQCVLAPSIVHGSQYDWVQGYTPWDMPVAHMPDWLVKLAVKATTVAQAQPIQVPKLPKETREQVLIALTYIPADDYDVWKNVGMALKIHDFDIATWIDWSQKSSKFKLGDCEEKWKSFKRDGIRIGTIFHYAKRYGFKFPPNYFSLSDIGNGEKLALNFGHLLRWCPSEKRWYYWTGKVWKVDNEEKPLTFAKEVVKMLIDEANTKGEHEWAAASTALPKIRAMLDISKDDVAITVDSFNDDPFLLNVDNGIINMKTGKLMPHSPDYFMNKISPVAFDAKVIPHRFLQFLNEIYAGDIALIDYVQKAFGYSATADTTEQVFFIHAGGGSNGKGRLLRAIMGALGMHGGYTLTTDPSLLTHKQRNTSSEDEYQLMGARLALIAESAKEKEIDAEKLKRLTGEDWLNAALKYGHNTVFKPTHKLHLYTNELPDLKNQSHAVWRRTRVIPYFVQFGDEPGMLPKDEKLLDKLLSELPGVLNWIIDGCLKWQAEGLKPTSAVIQATNNYRESQDALADFFRNRCYIKENAKVQKAVMWAEYEQYVADFNPDIVLSKKDFSKRLSESFKDKRFPAAEFWLGIGLERQYVLSAEEAFAPFAPAA